MKFNKIYKIVNYLRYERNKFIKINYYDKNDNEKKYRITMYCENNFIFGDDIIEINDEYIKEYCSKNIVDNFNFDNNEYVIFLNKDYFVSTSENYIKRYSDKEYSIKEFLIKNVIE